MDSHVAANAAPQNDGVYEIVIMYNVILEATEQAWRVA